MPKMGHRDSNLTTFLMCACQARLQLSLRSAATPPRVAKQHTPAFDSWIKAKQFAFSLTLLVRVPGLEPGTTEV
jgi:hypothetical protein